MEPREARALLQVDESVDAKALERAYLRAVKRHKPERDPEGFQRVREAYEQLRGWAPSASPRPPKEPAPIDLSLEPSASAERSALAREERLRALEVELEDRTGRSRLPPLREALGDDREDPELREWLFDELLDLGEPDDLDEAEALIDDAPPSLVPELAANLARERHRSPREELWRQIWSESPERRVELLHDALAKAPEDDGVRDDLVHELLALERGREAAELARDAEPSVRSFLFDEVARRSPADLSDDMLDELRGTGSLAIVSALIERGAIDEAERCVVEAIDRLSGGYLGDVLEGILGLAAAGEAEVAGSLLQRLTTVLERLGIATQVSQQDALTMLLLGELLAARGELPTPVCEIMLSGIRAFDGFEQAREQAKRWACVESAEAQLAMEVLARRAPNLSTIVGDAFQPPRSRRRPTSLMRSQPPWWLVLVGVMMFTGFVRGATLCTRDPAPGPPPPRTAWVPEDPLAYACHREPTHCDAIRELWEASRTRDCARSRSAEPGVREAITALEAGDARAVLAAEALQRLIGQFELGCAYTPPP